MMVHHVILMSINNITAVSSTGGSRVITDLIRSQLVNYRGLYLVDVHEKDVNGNWSPVGMSCRKKMPAELITRLRLISMSIKFDRPATVSFHYYKKWHVIVHHGGRFTWCFCWWRPRSRRIIREAETMNVISLLSRVINGDIPGVNVSNDNGK